MHSFGGQQQVVCICPSQMRATGTHTHTRPSMFSCFLRLCHFLVLRTSIWPVCRDLTTASVYVHSARFSHLNVFSRNILEFFGMHWTDRNNADLRILGARDTHTQRQQHTSNSSTTPSYVFDRFDSCQHSHSQIAQMRLTTNVYREWRTLICFDCCPSAWACVHVYQFRTKSQFVGCAPRSR